MHEGQLANAATIPTATPIPAPNAIFRTLFDPRFTSTLFTSVRLVDVSCPFFSRTRTYSASTDASVPLCSTPSNVITFTADPGDTSITRRHFSTSCAPAPGAKSTPITAAANHCEFFIWSYPSNNAQNPTSTGAPPQSPFRYTGLAMVTIEPLRIETELEEDGRILASVPDLPGVMAYGATSDEAIRKVKALALQVLADMIESGEEIPTPLGPFAA